MSKPEAKILPPEIYIQVIELTPLVSIDLIVVDSQGRVLLGLRANRPAQNMWFVPGGRVCKDERLAAAFERISLDELGLALRREDAEFLGVFEHIYPDNFLDRPGFGTHYIVLAHRVVLHEALPPLPEDQHAAYRWFSVAELLAHPQVHENTRAYFR